MKAINKLMALIAVMGVVQSGKAALYDFATSDGGITYVGGGSTLNQIIPDNTKAGVGYTINFGFSGVNISDLSISLNLSGGYNGDIYAYVSHGGMLVQLLNPNPGVSGSGINITLNQTGSSIPTGGSGTLTGSYVSYGDLSTFNGTSAGGDWTVFFSDLSAGDKSTLNSFSLSVTAVPEPVNTALGVFGAVLVAGVLAQQCFNRNKQA